MSDADLDALLTEVWDRLTQAVETPAAPFRTPVLASLAADGSPDQRMVVLRGCDPRVGLCTVYSDTRAAKVAQVAEDPRVHLLFWDSAPGLQLRMRGRAQVFRTDETAAIWAELPEHGRALYGAEPTPGAEIAAPDQMRAGRDPGAAFAALGIRIETIEVLHLARPHHRRAHFARAEEWLGVWLAP